MDLSSSNTTTLASLPHGDEPSSLEIDDEAEPIEKRVKPFQYVAVGIVALSGLMYGLDLGTIGASYVMDGFRQHVNWDCASSSCGDVSDNVNRDKGLISFFFGIGATIGSMVNPYFAERYGRCSSLALSTVVYMVGAVFQTYLPTMELLWVGRFLVGMGVGMLSMVAPVYIAECAPSHARGSFGILYDLATSFGILAGSAASVGLKDWHSGWRIAYGGGIPFAFLLLLAVLFKVIPESPRWLAAHELNEALAATLARLRFPEELDAELELLRSEVEEKREMGDASWKEVFSTSNMMRRRVLLGVFFFAIQQLCGGAAVQFYAPDILNTFFTEDQAIRGTLALGLLGFLATSASAFAVDRFGRTKLLVYNGVIMFLSLVPLAICSALEQTQALGWAALGASAIYLCSMSLSWGPALYVLCAEMFPYRTRGKATGVTTMSHWLFATIVGAVFPLASSVSLPACFIFFAVSILLGSGVVYFLQVETTGKSFAQIDEAFLLHEPNIKRKDW